MLSELTRRGLQPSVTGESTPGLPGFTPLPSRGVVATATDAQRLHGHRQVTDAYLLALAVHHDGRLVTNDRRIARVAVPGATDAHLIVAL